LKILIRTSSKINPVTSNIASKFSRKDEEDAHINLLV